MELYNHTNDPFLDSDNAIKRLVDEWNEYGLLIIAFDYDNTVYDYHKKGLEFPLVSKLLRDCKGVGAHLVCFTSCDETRYDDIRAYLRSKDIPFDAINETPDFIPFKGRKIYFNVLLDDRAGLKEGYQNLRAAYEMRRIHLHNQKYKDSQDIEF